jgi:AraC-like DNA-binding protein
MALRSFKSPRPQEADGAVLLSLSEIHRLQIDRAWLSRVLESLPRVDDAALQRDGVRPPANALEDLILCVLRQDVSGCLNSELNRFLPERGDPLVNRTLAFIGAAYQSAALSLRQIAAAVGSSERQLSRRFRAATNTTLMGYVHRVRIEHARQLLSNRSLSTKEIAALVGYSATSRLDLHFKRAYGVTPSEYRAAQGLDVPVASRP